MLGAPEVHTSNYPSAPCRHTRSLAVQPLKVRAGASEQRVGRISSSLRADLRALRASAACSPFLRIRTLGDWCQTAECAGWRCVTAGTRGRRVARQGRERRSRSCSRWWRPGSAWSWRFRGARVAPPGTAQRAQAVPSWRTPSVASRLRLVAAASRAKSWPTRLRPRTRARLPPWRRCIMCPNLRSTLGRVAR